MGSRISTWMVFYSALSGPGAYLGSLFFIAFIALLLGFTTNRPTKIPRNVLYPVAAKDFAERCGILANDLDDVGRAVRDRLKQGSSNFAINEKVKFAQLAILNCNRAIQLSPQLADSYLLRGFAEEQLSDKQSALRDYQQAQNIYRQQGKNLDAQTLQLAINRTSK